MTQEQINRLLTGNDIGAAIKELRNGRSKPLPGYDNAKQDLDPSGHKVMNPLYRRDKWVKVQDPDSEAASDIPTEEGISVGAARPGMKIVKVERIALALQRLIVERAVSFAFGNPVEHDANPNDGTLEQDVFNSVMRVLQDVKIRSVDRKIGRSLFSTTEVAELWYTIPSQNRRYGFDSDFKLRVAIFSPEKGDTLYPYFDDQGDLIAFSREYSIKDADLVVHRYFETYTSEYQYRWQLDEKTWTLEPGYPMQNAIGKIPIVYGEQTETEWASVQNLIDRLELLLSNFADTNDYHASPKIFVTGSIQGWAQKGESGAVIEGEEGSSAQYLSWQQAPEAVRLEIDTLLKMIYTITQTPDISFDNVKGLGTVSGVAMKLLFMDAHLKVQSKSEILDEYMQRRMSIVQSFLKQMNAKNAAFGEACDSLIIEPRLHPYMIDDETTTVSMLMTATGQKQICSRKNAIQRLGWVDDVQAEIKSIEEEETATFQMNDVFSPEGAE